MIELAYQGYLIKIGDYKIPLNYIRAETYSALKSGQDLDSYRDADGKLHRTALEHFLYKVEFETKAMLTNTEMTELLSNIQEQYIDKTEKKVHMTLYVPETDSYEEQDAYMPDIPFSPYIVTSEYIKYNPTRIAFIGY